MGIRCLATPVVERVIGAGLIRCKLRSLEDHCAHLNVPMCGVAGLVRGNGESGTGVVRGPRDVRGRMTSRTLGRCTLLGVLPTRLTSTRVSNSVRVRSLRFFTKEPLGYVRRSVEAFVGCKLGMSNANSRASVTKTPGRVRALVGRANRVVLTTRRGVSKKRKVSL